jgi:hypothetical protein
LLSPVLHEPRDGRASPSPDLEKLREHREELLPVGFDLRHDLPEFLPCLLDSRADLKDSRPYRKEPRAVTISFRIGTLGLRERSSRLRHRRPIDETSSEEKLAARFGLRHVLSRREHHRWFAREHLQKRGADRSEAKSSMSQDRDDRDVFVDDGKELRQVG